METFSLLEHWLEKCLHNHSACASSEEGNRGQTLAGIRFLQIIDRSTIVSREDTAPRQYVCLSHCWGGSEAIPKTTTATKLIHASRGLQVKDLPKTFEQTVYVCQRLGIYFL